MIRIRVAVFTAVLLLLGLIWTSAVTRSEEPPPKKELTAEQKQKLKERDRYAQETAKLRQQGKRPEAIAAAEKMLAIEREVFGNVHEDVAGSLEQLAEMHAARENFAAAKKARQEVLAIKTKLYGEYHWQVTDARLALANLETISRLSPADRRQLAEAARLNGLVGSLYRQGKFQEALKPAQEVVRIAKQLLGERHRNYATSLNELAYLYKSMGDYAKAEPLLRQSLDIRKQALGEKHPLYARSLNNLATLYHDMGDYAQAEPLYRQALEINKQALGEKHPDYATSLNNLAGVYWSMGDYAKAEPFYRHALDIFKQALGEKHPLYATNLNNLAELYRSMGDYAKAEPLYRQALDLHKQALGEKHPLYAASLHNLAGMYWSMGDYGKAEPLYRQALQINRSQMELTATVQSERQQLQMIDNLRVYLEKYLSVSGEMSTAAEQVYADALSWKGSVTARQQSIRRMRLAIQKGDQEVAKRYAQLEQTTRKLATLSRASPDSKNPDQLRRDLENLSEEVERLQKNLAGVSADFRRQQEQQSRTAEEIRKVIPADTVLVDLFIYKHYSRPKSGKGKLDQQSRVVAFVIPADKPLQRLELGPLEPIALAISDWRKSFGMPSGWHALNEGKGVETPPPSPRPSKTQGVPPDQGGPGAELRKLVWEPLQPHVRGAKTVLISPDGALARFPWAALPGQEPGSYLIEEVGIAVVPVPQLLPELLAAEQKVPEPSLLLVGDVDFGAAPGKPVELVSSKTSPREEKRGGGLEEFRALDNTRQEIVAIRDSFEQWQPHKPMTMLRKGEATESGVREQAPKHRYLHFATHGYFAPPKLRSALGGRVEIQPTAGDGLLLPTGYFRLSSRPVVGDRAGRRQSTGRSQPRRRHPDRAGSRRA